jgi:hypothetical protein
MMEIKKAQHDDLMKNVWGAGSTGVSIASITVPDADAADELIAALFKKTLVADVANFEKVRKVFRKTMIGNEQQ